jgi:hypothetical protein
MEIERTTFGTITIAGKTYEHDVIIRLSGEVARRKKKLSKKYYGTSHVLSKEEAKFVFESGCEQLILGSGQMGNVHLSPEAEAYFAKKGCAVLLQPTPKAIHTFNSSHAKKIGFFTLPVESGRPRLRMTCACRKPIGWRLAENRAMLICNKRSCQAHCVGGWRSVSVAGSNRGRDLNVAAADHCSATNRPQEAILWCHRPVSVRWSLSPLPSRS